MHSFIADISFYMKDVYEACNLFKWLEMHMALLLWYVIRFALKYSGEVMIYGKWAASHWRHKLSIVWELLMFDQFRGIDQKVGIVQFSIR